MQPNIEYATAADGLRIAYWAIGQGPPLVYLAPLPSHVQLEWQFPVTRTSFELLSRRYTVVRFDGRGSGLSQRGNLREDYGTEAFALDLEAVADRLGFQDFTIFANGPSGIPAMIYAAQRSSRVSSLVLWECIPSLRVMSGNSRYQALLALLQNDYEIYTETMANLFFGWTSGDSARDFAKMLRQSQSREEAAATMAAFTELDASPFLAGIEARTLVIHHATASLVSTDVITDLAAKIPNARLAILEGNTVAGDLTSRTAIGAVDSFLLGREYEEEGSTVSSPIEPTAGTAVILFADISDSTSLTETLGDAEFRSQARDLDSKLRDIVRAAHGVAIDGKLVGDGVMAVFASAGQAIDCAVRCEAATNGSLLRLHLGVHAGDVIRENGNIYGGAVNVAARIADAAASGEILVSDVVRALARTSSNVAFEDRGEHQLKGVAEAQRLYAVMEKPAEEP